VTKQQSKVMKSFQIKTITKLGQGTFDSIDLKNPIFSRWLVGFMADNKIPFQVVHLGEGVTRIIKSGSVCPHCQGKGFVNVDQTPVHVEIPEHLKDSLCCDGNKICSCKGGCADGGECCKAKSKAA